jgi:hypothetical protein
MLIHRSRRHTLSALAIGFMAGGASINNLEFGVPAVISVILVEVILGWQLREKLKRVIFVISGVLISWLLFVLLLSVSGRRFKLENYSLFVRLFGGGLLQEPMPTFGPHIFVISIFVSGIAVGTLQLLRAKHSQDSFDSEGRTMNAAITAVYFGLIGLGTFPYFVNRSVISGQLQIFLLFVAPIIASSFSLLRLGDYRITNRRNTATLLVMVFPQSLLFGSIFQMPNGVNEWNRVINPQAMTYSNHLSEVESAIAKAEVVLNSQIELFSISHGNLFLGSSDVRNISLIDNPAELNNPLARGSGLVQLFCRNMDTYSVVERQLILVENFFETESGLPLCRNYRKVLAVSEKFSVVVRAS